VSGDSDFSPLVSKLRENNKTVIGVGVKNSTSDLFIGNCDEFIFYDDLVREQQKRRNTRLPKAAPASANGEGKKDSAKPEGRSGGRGPARSPAPAEAPAAEAKTPPPPA